MNLFEEKMNFDESAKAIMQRVENRQKELKSLSNYLHELESQLSLIFAFSPDLIVLSDGEGKIIRTNHAVFKILGYLPSEMVGKYVWDFIKNEDLESTKKIREKILKNDVVFIDASSTFSNHWRKKDGDYARLVWRFAYYDAVNGVMIKFATDFTSIEAENPYLAELIVNCVKNANSGIVITDAKKKDNPIIYSNKKFEEMSGFTPKQLLGKNCRVLNINDRNQKAITTLKTAIEEGIECDVLLKNFKPNGEEWFNHLSIEPIKNSKNEIVNFIGISRDVSHQIKEREFSWDNEAVKGFGKKI